MSFIFAGSYMARLLQVANQLRRAYKLMRSHFGHQGWWPGDSQFEVCVGAILTQNTNWKNVQKAIERLKQAALLDPQSMYEASEERLAALIRPAGYYNVKVRRLKAFVKTLVERFGGCFDRFFEGEIPEVRTRLLSIPGIGPETADSMILYAGQKPTFVVDAYTRRIFHRHGWCGETDLDVKRSGLSKSRCKASYDDLKRICEGSLSHLKGAALIDYWQDYHAQLVAVGKKYCSTRNPKCEACPLRLLLPSFPAGEIGTSK